MAHSSFVGVLVPVVIALTLAAAQAARPSWMPVAPPLPVKGRVVNVSTVPELRAALDGARDGDTIAVADGTYQLDRFLTLTGRNRVTLRGASGDASKVVLRGLGWDSNTDRDDILRVQACTNVTVSYLTFTDCHAYGLKLEQLPSEGRQLRNVNIYACSFSNCGTRAVKGTGGGGGFVDGGSVRYCNFENTKVPPPTWYLEGDYITAIDCMRLKDWTIADCFFKDIRGAHGGGRGAIFVWVESQNVTSERNVFVGCDRAVAYGNPSGSTEGPAKPHNTGGVIRNNFIVVGKDTGVEICWAKGVRVYHNTILAREDGLAIHYHWSELRDIEIANNLVRGRIVGDAPGVALRDNVTSGIEDAWFRNVGGGDLHLTAAGKAGVGLVSRVAGAEVDFDGRKRPAKTRAGADE